MFPHASSTWLVLCMLSNVLPISWCARKNWYYDVMTRALYINSTGFLQWLASYRVQLWELSQIKLFKTNPNSFKDKALFRHLGVMLACSFIIECLHVITYLTK